MILLSCLGIQLEDFIVKRTHLLLEGKTMIAQMLSEQQSFKQITLAVGKNCTSISREVRNPMEFRWGDV